MERYSEYKDSGVKWLGEIPSHWEPSRNKAIFRETKAVVGKYSKNFTLLSLTKKGVIVRNLDDGGKFPAEFDTYKIVEPGDFIFCFFDVDETPRAIGLSANKGMITGAYTVLKQNTANSRYLYYYYLSIDNAKALKPLYSGLRKTVPLTSFMSMQIFLPPKEEQDAIVRYLDAATSKIDKAIAMQQKMIDLLNERKQIIIQNAVTKGLDDKVEMKDSGVEWIGMIPKHWEICPFKRLIKIKNGADYKKYEVQDNGFPVIGSGGVFAYSSKYAYDGESLLLGRKGTIDKPMYFKGKFWTVDTMFYGIPKDNADCKYLYYQALTIPFKLYATSTAIPSMTQTDLYNNPMCFPCKEEQKAIADYLDLAIKPFDSAISNCQRQIVLLQERKQIIINEVITGKVKVS